MRVICLDVGDVLHWLPAAWDQKAYFATTVGTNILTYIPFVGGSLKSLLRGGTEMGQLTLSRFFVLHVLLIPAFILFFCCRPRFSVSPELELRANSRRA